MDEIRVTSPLRILAISGSLRAWSSNSALLRSAIPADPAAIEIDLYERHLIDPVRNR